MGRMVCKPLRLGVVSFLVVLLAAVRSVPLAFCQTTSPPPVSTILEWENWFYGQRIYGLGYIPDDALAKAVSQRDGSHPVAKFAPQLLRNPAITEGRWFTMGPAGMVSVKNDLVSGRITSLAIDPLSPSTVYITAAAGGVWKSTNRGGQWAPLTDHLPSLASGAVAVDPFSGEVWYGTGELNFCRDCFYGAGVYRSPDGGTTWSRVSPENFLSSPTSVIVFDHQNEGTLFIGRASALWKSSDGGLSWRAVLQGVITDFIMSPTDSSVAYAAIGNFSGSPENGVYRTTDGGETWTRLTNGLPPQSTMGRIALATAPLAPSIVYALIVRSSDFNLNGLYRSADGGNTWSQIHSVPQALFTEDGRGQGLFNLVVAIDPGNEAVIYVGGIELWKSTDLGASWQNLSIPAGLHEDQRDIVFDPSDPRTFYLIGDSGVWRSSDGGLSFTNLNDTLAVTQFQTVGLHPTDPNQAVGGTQDNGTAIYRGSFAWDQGRAGDSGAAFYDASDPQIIYTVANRLSLRRSHDGGQTFHTITDGLDASDRVLFYPPFVPHPTEPETLYFATHRLWRSQDRGDHWVPLSEDLTRGGSATISALALAPSNPQVIYAGTSDGQVQVSGNGGPSWARTALLPDRFVTHIAVHPQLPQRAWVGLSGFGTGHVFRTDNGGGTWEDISRNLPDIPVNVILLDAATPETVYVGTDIGVFVLTEDGSWTPLNEGMPNTIVLGLAQNLTTGLLVAATHGRGAFAIALSEPATNVPRIDALLNTAGFQPGPLAPGMSVALFGANLAAEAAFPAGLFPLPSSLGGTTVLVNDVPASLLPARAAETAAAPANPPLAVVRLLQSTTLPAAPLACVCPSPCRHCRTSPSSSQAHSSKPSPLSHFHHGLLM